MYIKYLLLVIFASASAKVDINLNSNIIADVFHEQVEKALNLSKRISGKSLKDEVITNEIHANEARNTSDDVNEIGNVIDTSDEIRKPEVKVDNGTALILTPLIKEGRIDEALNASTVNPELFLGVKSYSGFLTVNETYNSNLFFWFFPVFNNNNNKPLNQTPWIIWLQGGPGASSMIGLFNEIGPFNVCANGSLIRNEYTWLRNHSLLFFDNPVGTGFSFTDHKEGFARNMETYTTHLYTAIQQFVQLFPELRTAPLYIAGESYAGKYIPSIALEIHRRKDEAGQDLNLQGIILANAYVDPVVIQNITMNFYHFGQLDGKQVEVINPLAEMFQKAIASNDSIDAKNKWTSLVTVILLASSQKQGFNYLLDRIDMTHFQSFFKSSEVKRALHVGDIQFLFVNMTVNLMIAPDFLTTRRPHLETLLENYRVLTICGQLDQLLSCAPLSEFYRTLQWNRREEFLESSRFPIYFERRRAGYYKSGGGLTEVLVRGAGHMSPMDKPGAVRNLVERWTHRLSVGMPKPELSNSFLTELIKNFTEIHNNMTRNT